MKELNLVEILKDCPQGTKLYSPVCGKCTFLDVADYDPTYPIAVHATNGTPYYFTADGRFFDDEGTECLLFPSKDQRDWSKFQRPYKEGDIVFYNNTISIFKEWGDETLFRAYVCIYLCCEGLIDEDVPLFGKSIRKEIRFATEEEKQELFQAIKDNGYKWNAVTKTLEKLEVEKFDINTLVPFESKVLVREKETDVWQPAFYGFFNQHNKRFYTTSTTWLMCIPYNEDTKHLIGTKSDCNKYYKTWEA